MLQKFILLTPQNLCPQCISYLPTHKRINFYSFFTCPLMIYHHKEAFPKLSIQIHLFLAIVETLLLSFRIPIEVRNYIFDNLFSFYTVNVMSTSTLFEQIKQQIKTILKIQKEYRPSNSIFQINISGKNKRSLNRFIIIVNYPHLLTDTQFNEVVKNGYK